MELSVLAHICSLQSEMFRMPIYIYSKDGTRLHAFEPVPANFDLVGSFWNELTETEQSYHYILTTQLIIIGCIKDENTEITVILGPVSIGNVTEQTVRGIISRSNCNLDIKNKDEIFSFLEASTKATFDSFLSQMAIYHAMLNNKKIFSQDLIDEKESDKAVFPNVSESSKTFEDIWIHSNVQLESKLLYYIQHGRTAQLKKEIHHSVSSPFGQFASNYFRHLQNAGIIFTSLSLRAAIKGGLDPVECYQLGEIYIQRMEACSNIKKLYDLMAELSLDFCTRVERKIIPYVENTKIQKALQYISENCQNHISVQDIADYLKCSKEYLSSKFIQETGTSIPDFVKWYKIQSAKELLLFSDLSLSEIAYYFSFSSQSYFQTVFKQIEGYTPKQFKNTNQKQFLTSILPNDYPKYCNGTRHLM